MATKCCYVCVKCGLAIRLGGNVPPGRLFDLRNDWHGDSRPHGEHNPIEYRAIFGLAFGVAFLGESLTMPVTVGTLSIVIGVMALAKRDGKGEDTSWPLWALALPVLAAVIRVGAHLLTKVGMEEIPTPTSQVWLPITHHLRWP